GAQIGSFLTDRIYRRLSKRNNGEGRPEFRAPLMMLGSFIVPIGLLWYVWSAEARTHWIVPDLGVAFFIAGLITCHLCIQAYIVDTYTRYASSAIAASTFLT